MIVNYENRLEVAHRFLRQPGRGHDPEYRKSKLAIAELLEQMAAEIVRLELEIDYVNP